MGQEPELKNTNSLQKEFQNLLDKDFKDRKLKENEIIKATVTEITKNFVVVDCKAKMEGMIPVEEFKNDDELSKLKVGSKIEVFLERIESFKGEIIISREKARKMKPDFFLVLPVAFIKEFIQRESTWLKNGGKFIVPFPNFKIISKK